MRLDSADVVIIGGGVSGLSSAYFLAKAGVDVVVVEKGMIGGEASGRNGGSMSPRADEPPVIPMADVARRLWPTLADELGYPTEFIEGGRLQVAMTEEEVGLVSDMEKNSLGFGIQAEIMTPQQARRLIPELSERVLGGLFFPNAGHSNPQRVVQAYGWACQDRGGRLYQGTPATGINVTGGRITGIETSAGTVQADVVVIAAGPQTGIIADMAGILVPVAPGRVEIIATIPVESRFEAMLAGNGLYGRQALRGNLIFGGGPHEWVDVALSDEPSKPNTPVIRSIARRLAELLPALEDLAVLRAWSGVVEQTPDRYPIIDKLDYPEGLVVVTVSGNGYGLSPATGTAVKELIVDGSCSFDISGFKLDRFRDVPANWRKAWGWQAGSYNT